MRKSLVLLLLVLSSYAYSQTLESFKYQAVARTKEGQVLANKTVDFKITILQGDPSGTEVYAESHNVTSNKYGLLNLQIGNGNSPSGVFADINWGAALHYIKIEMDYVGHGNFEVVGTSPLLSVPYALHTKHAKTAEKVLTNELVKEVDVVGSKLVIIYPDNSSKEIDISAIVNDTDDQQLSFNAATGVITLQDGGNIDLTAYVDNKINNKINKSDYDKLVARVAVLEANTYTRTEIDNKLADKANQSDLNTTNTNVAKNTSDIAANATEIAKKANQTDLNATNTNVTNNTTNITTNSADIVTNMNNIATNTTEIAKKANQSDLNTTNTNVANNTASINANTAAIAANATEIAKKANQTQVDDIETRLKDVEDKLAADAAQKKIYYGKHTTTTGITVAMLTGAGFQSADVDKTDINVVFNVTDGEDKFCVFALPAEWKEPKFKYNIHDLFKAFDKINNVTISGIEYAIWVSNVGFPAGSNFNITMR